MTCLRDMIPGRGSGAWFRGVESGKERAPARSSGACRTAPPARAFPGVVISIAFGDHFGSKAFPVMLPRPEAVREKCG